MEEFLNSLFGTYSTGMWFAYFFFAIIGTIAFSWIEVKNRDKNSIKTPFRFKWRFFIFDNIKRYVATAIIIYIQFRFYKEISHSDMSEYAAVLIGFNSDGIAGVVKRVTKILQIDRAKLTKEVEHEP